MWFKIKFEPRVLSTTIFLQSRFNLNCVSADFNILSIKEIAKIRILVRRMSIVIVCKEWGTYILIYSHMRGKSGGFALFEATPKNIPYKNKANKSRASDVYLMGNEIGCRCIRLFLSIEKIRRFWEKITNRLCVQSNLSLYLNWN